jgi:hypothetical protein
MSWLHLPRLGPALPQASSSIYQYRVPRLLLFQLLSLPYLMYRHQLRPSQRPHRLNRIYYDMS